MKSAKNKLLEYAENQYRKEKDKWDSGMKNQLYEWEDLVSQLKDWLKR